MPEKHASRVKSSKYIYNTVFNTGSTQTFNTEWNVCHFINVSLYEQAYIEAIVVDVCYVSPETV